ncbi:MAG: nitrogenase component 1 [Deltaproteobacteria bacterium]|jgi:nitrogenase molybdenum-iron protein alpha chain|nr:nitrogenase component 1 [Deltaproteobacteria bacterium]
MSYLDSLIPPIREHRHPETALAHGSTRLGHGQRRNTCAVLAQAERSFTQGSICPLLPALGIMTSLPETVVLLHGAVGCGSCAAGNNVNIRAGNTARGRASKDAVWLSTALNEINVINGGEEKLTQAIIEAESLYHPKAILAVSGCLPGVIGDDIDGVAARIQEQVTAKILPVHCEGFKSRFMATAYDVVYHAVGRHLMPAKAVGPKDPKLINVMNVGSMGLTDEKEITRILGELGLRTNFFPVFSHPESFADSTRAAMSISICPTHDDYFLNHLSEKYGVPYIIRHMPIGIKNTGQWIADIGLKMGLGSKAENLIKKEEEELLAALDEFKPLFKDKSAFVSAGEYRSLATALLLRELGFKVLGIRSFHFDSFAEVELDKLETGADFVFNVANVQPFEEANLLKKLKPDIFLGHWHGNSTAARLGIPTQVIYNSGYAYMGYQGAYDLARRLHRRLANPSFYQRLAGYARLPYREQWYDKDPFSFIRESV